jgi:hypothetical protein
MSKLRKNVAIILTRTVYLYVHVIEHFLVTNGTPFVIEALCMLEIVAVIRIISLSRKLSPHRVVVDVGVPIPVPHSP